MKYDIIILSKNILILMFPLKHDKSIILTDLIILVLIEDSAYIVYKLVQLIKHRISVTEYEYRIL